MEADALSAEEDASSPEAERPAPDGLTVASEPDGLTVASGVSRGGRVCIAVAGELDLLHSDQLKAWLDREASDGRRVLLDLSAVTFIDSSGLAVILNALNQSRKGGGKLELCAALCPQARRLFEVSGVLPMLPLVDDGMGDGNAS